VAASTYGGDDLGGKDWTVDGDVAGGDTGELV